jgi:RNA polymerase sigma factor (sigma-70 family)
MSSLTGETTRLVRRLSAGEDQARGDLIAHAYDRLYRLARKMLREDYPRLHRWEQTDDVLHNALLRLHKALAATPIASAKHFWNLASQHIEWQLLDLVRHHDGPQAHAANHHTDCFGAADDPEGPLARQPAGTGEPSSTAEWAEFLERVRELPEDEREVFRLHWLQGLKQEAVADALHISVREVRRRWQTAKLLLARLIDPEATS